MSGRLGVLGGTFDPPHIGHLIVAQDVVEGLQLDRLLIVPAGRPPHREAVLPPAMRLELALEAFGVDPRFEVCRVEVERPGPSYTVDTLRWVRDTYDPATLYCVIGADQFRVIETWNRYEELVRWSRLAVMARGGDPPVAGEVALPFESVAVTRVDVSSTRVRERLREGRSIRHLVPESIRGRVEEGWRARCGAGGGHRTERNGG